MGEVRAVKTDKIDLQQGNRPKPYPQTQPYDLNDDLSYIIDFNIEDVSHEDTLSYTAPGIQRKVLTKLRKGFYAVETEIDLHGLNSESAKQQLLRFLNISVESGYRCVHIIHGKGYRSSENQPILKNNLNRWLRQHKDVQAFCSAPHNQGGAGAVYVLLNIAKDYLD